MTTLWTVHTDYGMAIKDYHTDDYDEAEQRAIREVGTRAFKSIEEATKDEILWVAGMAGYLPKAAREFAGIETDK